VKVAGLCSMCSYRGLSNDRVHTVDFSILPDDVGANTCLTALLVGEKAAIVRTEELGLGSGLK
jgi:hypothetical protein